MVRTYIKELSNKIGELVLIQGWVQVVRDQKKISFLVVRDITGSIQAVMLEKPSKITLESVVAITGQVVSNVQAPHGFEIKIESLDILSKANPELPIPVVEKGDRETDQAKRLDWRWLDLRKPKNLLIFKTWTVMEHAFINYWISHGYIEIHSPKLMSSPSESKSELFSLPYFETTAYLAQSPQFYKQMAMASGFEKVFEIGPIFRANPSFTSRHDTEFTGYDMEVSFIDSHQDIISIESELLVSILKTIKEKLGNEINQTFGVDIKIPSLPFPQVTMAQAKKTLKDEGVTSEKEGDLSPEEERKLAELFQDKQGHEFVFITDYPVDVRPFYHMRHKNNPGLTKSFDLLWKGLEITTGAQREHRYDNLRMQALDKGHDITKLEHYLEFFKYGCPPHGGLGFGPSRFIMKMLNMSNVREVTYLYRGVNRLSP